MKCLTVRQPWASLIMAGIKTVENRSWNTSYRGTLVIHAGRGIDKPAMREHGHLLDEYPSGTILGTVELVDCIRDSTSPWAEDDQWHWILADVKPWAEPVAATGRLGLWNCDIAAPAPAPAPEPEHFASGRQLTARKSMTDATPKESIDPNRFATPYRPGVDGDGYPTGGNAMFTAPAISITLAAVSRPQNFLVCDCGADLSAPPAAGCIQPCGHVIVLKLNQLDVVMGPEPDGSVGADFSTDRGSYASMTPAEARQLAAAFNRVADETDRLAALAS
jgi:hypothetical protein